MNASENTRSIRWWNGRVRPYWLLHDATKFATPPVLWIPLDPDSNPSIKFCWNPTVITTLGYLSVPSAPPFKVPQFTHGKIDDPRPALVIGVRIPVSDLAFPFSFDFVPPTKDVRCRYCEKYIRWAGASSFPTALLPPIAIYIDALFHRYCSRRASWSSWIRRRLQQHM